MHVYTRDKGKKKNNGQEIRKEGRKYLDSKEGGSSGDDSTSQTDKEEDDWW